MGRCLKLPPWGTSTKCKQTREWNIEIVQNCRATALAFLPSLQCTRSMRLKTIAKACYGLPSVFVATIRLIYSSCYAALCCAHSLCPLVRSFSPSYVLYQPLWVYGRLCARHAAQHADAIPPGRVLSSGVSRRPFRCIRQARGVPYRKSQGERGARGSSRTTRFIARLNLRLTIQQQLRWTYANRCSIWCMHTRRNGCSNKKASTIESPFCLGPIPSRLVWSCVVPCSLLLFLLP